MNGYIRFEGVLKIYWGLKKSIKLAPGVLYAKARNNRDSIYDFVSVDDAAYVLMLEEAQKVCVLGGRGVVWLCVCVWTACTVNYCVCVWGGGG